MAGVDSRPSTSPLSTLSLPLPLPLFLMNEKCAEVERKTNFRQVRVEGRTKLRSRAVGRGIVDETEGVRAEKRW